MPDRTPPSRPAAACRRALALLRQDHQVILAAFAQAEGMRPPIDALALMARVDDAVRLLARHALLEETVLYPAARPFAGERVDESEVEHASMATLMTQIQSGGPADARYVARFKVLGEYVRHHLREEEGSLFSRLEQAPLPWLDIEAGLLAAQEPPQQSPARQPLAPAPEARARTRARRDAGGQNP